MSLEAYKLKEVLTREAEALNQRRENMRDHGLETVEADDFARSKFGIALSGGGIRSATINLGFLKTLNAFKILQKSDYLSSVSGGGYCASYIQATLKERADYEKLFSKEDITHMRSYGAYLIPGQSATRKLWNTLILTVGYLVSLLMSLLGPALIVAAIVIFTRILGQIFGFTEAAETMPDILPGGTGEKTLWEQVVTASVYGMTFVFFVHLFSNIFLQFKLGVSKMFNRLETVLAVIILTVLTVTFLRELRTQAVFQIDAVHYFFPFIAPEVGRIIANLGLFFLLILSGFFLNPNALSFHRFYRNQLAEAYLKRADTYDNVPLHRVFNPQGKTVRDWLNPYPLINTCLNLQSPGGGESFKGSKANDYFLLSPLYCGAKLVDYVRTGDFPGYDEMTLPAATTISAAAVNPGMGNYSNKVLSVVMTLLNARLGFWVNNPKKRLSQSRYIVWWPFYFFYELFSKINTDNRKLNISDGGHIENLAVYELLRRRCRLIIAVDAGADPKGMFTDLNNLTIRARNELGIAIQFREQPEEMLTARPSHGYAQKRFVTADMYQIWEEFTVLSESGKPYTYTVTDEEGNTYTEQVEALVNYAVDADEKVMPSVTLKISEDRADISDRDRENAEESAWRMVREKLTKTDVRGKDVIKVGTLIYVKSTVLAPVGKPFLSKDTPENRLLFDTYKYKIYHPDFPHEPTSDQFFDPVQWEAYYRLGQYMAGAVLNCKSSEMKRLMRAWDEGDKSEVPSFSFDDLLAWWDEGKALNFDREPEPISDFTDELILEPRSTEPVEEEEIDYTLEGKSYPEKEERVSEPPVTPTPAPPPAIPDAAEEVDYEM